MRQAYREVADRGEGERRLRCGSPPTSSGIERVVEAARTRGYIVVASWRSCDGTPAPASSKIAIQLSGVPMPRNRRNPPCRRSVGLAARDAAELASSGGSPGLDGSRRDFSREPSRSRSRAAASARTRAGRAPASPGGSPASPRARLSSSSGSEAGAIVVAGARRLRDLVVLERREAVRLGVAERRMRSALGSAPRAAAPSAARTGGSAGSSPRAAPQEQRLGRRLPMPAGSAHGLRLGGSSGTARPAGRGRRRPAARRRTGSSSGSSARRGRSTIAVSRLGRPAAPARRHPRGHRRRTGRSSPAPASASAASACCAHSRRAGPSASASWRSTSSSGTPCWRFSSRCSRMASSRTPIGAEPYSSAGGRRLRQRGRRPRAPRGSCRRASPGRARRRPRRSAMPCPSRCRAARPRRSSP